MGLLRNIFNAIKNVVNVATKIVSPIISGTKSSGGSGKKTYNRGNNGTYSQNQSAEIDDHITRMKQADEASKNAINDLLPALFGVVNIIKDGLGGIKDYINSVGTISAETQVQGTIAPTNQNKIDSLAKQLTNNANPNEELDRMVQYGEITQEEANKIKEEIKKQKNSIEETDETVKKQDEEATNEEVDNVADVIINKYKLIVDGEDVLKDGIWKFDSKVDFYEIERAYEDLGLEISEEKLKSIYPEIINALKTKLLETESSETQNMFLDGIASIGAGIGASAANATTGIGKGIGNFFESILDTYLATKANVDNITGNAMAGLAGLFGNEELADDIRNTTSWWVNQTGDIIGNEYVNDAYESIYNTGIGNALDEAAFTIFEHDGIGTGVVSGVAEVAANAKLAVTTGTPTPLIAALSSFGKYFEEGWNNVSEKYSTDEKLARADIFGMTNAVWEAAQYRLGEWLNKIPGKTGIQSATNVFIDTGTNALDTPFRALTSGILNDKTFSDNFEEQGGWSSVITNAAVGAIGSTFGELWSKITSGKNKQPTQVEVIDKFLYTSDFNRKNLIEGINSNIPDDADMLERARIIYLKLNQSVSYDDRWWLNQRTSIYYRDFDVSNMENNKVVCSGWSKIYRDLLIEAGINPDSIEIRGANEEFGTHNWVILDIGDGKIVLADATNPIGGPTDLINVKTGRKTAGFIPTTREKFEEAWEMAKDLKRNGVIRSPVQIYTFKLLLNEDDVSSAINNLDNKLGYDSNRYLKEIETLFGMPKEVKTEERVQNFVDLINQRKWTSRELKEFIGKYANDIFGDDVKIIDNSEDVFDLDIDIKYKDGSIKLMQGVDDETMLMEYQGGD